MKIGIPEKRAIDVAVDMAVDMAESYIKEM